MKSIEKLAKDYADKFYFEKDKEWKYIYDAIIVGYKARNNTIDKLTTSNNKNLAVIHQLLKFVKHIKDNWQFVSEHIQKMAEKLYIKFKRYE